MPESHSYKYLHSLGHTKAHATASGDAGQNMSLSHWKASLYLMPGQLQSPVCDHWPGKNCAAHGRGISGRDSPLATKAGAKPDHI